MNEKFKVLESKTYFDKKIAKHLKKKISSEDITFYTMPNLCASNLFTFNQACMVTEVKKINEDTKIISFKTLQRAAFFKAGQYLDILFKKDLNQETRSFFILSTPKSILTNNTYTIVIKKSENDWAIKQMFDEWKTNQMFNASAPKGNFFIPLNELNKNYLFCVKDEYIIPCLSIIEDLVENKYSTKMVLLIEISDLNNLVWINKIIEILVKKQKEQIFSLYFFFSNSKITNDNSIVKKIPSNKCFYKPIDQKSIQELLLNNIEDNIRFVVSGDNKFNNFIKKQIDILLKDNKKYSILYNDYFVENVSFDTFALPPQEAKKKYKIKWYIDNNSVSFEGNISANQTIEQFLLNEFSFREIKKRFPNFFSPIRFTIVSGQVKHHPFFNQDEKIIKHANRCFPDSNLEIKLI